MVSIVFTGGGTGGHIYPGLAVASWIKQFIPCRLFWMGSSSGMDKTIVENAGIEFFGIPSGKLRRYVSLRNILDIFKVIAGFFAALKILKRERPALLFSKGGFVSVPPCAAARYLKIPVFTHESDFSPGLATRINTRFAEKIFIAYKESIAFFKGLVRERVCVSGNPVRTEFAVADSARGRKFLSLGDDERILLVLGGSLGSREINNLVWASLPELTKHYTVVHQTGEDTAGSAIEASARYKPYAYFKDEIPHIIAAAELVICRSGAGTIWECKSLKKPMVLIPLSGSGTRGDQIENARLFEKAGAAICVLEDGDRVPAVFSALINSLAEDSQRRRAMGEAGLFDSKDAGMIPAEFIAKEIIKRIGEET